MKKNKIRLDMLLIEKGMLESMTIAQTLIMDGKVFVNGVKIIKPGTPTEEGAEITIKEKLRYVGRGALKIEEAFKVFNPEIKDKIVLDIGASTGGFTDFVLQSGAKKVYAVDVGYGQLDYRLLNDARVVNLEKVNARYLSAEHVPEKVDFVTIDTSFISVTKFLENLLQFMRKDARILILIKPQFEAQRKFVKKGGVVKDIEVHKNVIKNIVNYAESIGLFLCGLTPSPIKGPAGNVEYLALFEADKSKAVWDLEYTINKAIGDQD